VTGELYLSDGDPKMLWRCLPEKDATKVVGNYLLDIPQKAGWLETMRLESQCMSFANSGDRVHFSPFGPVKTLRGVQQGKW
jgi:hypothetical protein